MKHALFFAFLVFSCSLSAQYAVDPNFGYNDIDYVFDTETGSDIWFDSALDSEGNIYFCGWTEGPISLTLGSMTMDGEYNPDYSPQYNRHLAIPNTTQANGYGIAMRSDDKPVIAGMYVVDGQDLVDIFVMQANNIGFQDSNFGTQGVFQAQLGGDSFVGDVLVGTDNAVYVLGRVESPGSGAESYLMIKLDANGQPDPTFDSDGYFTFNSGSTNRFLNTGFLLEDGSILVGGSLAQRQIAKVLPNGTLDTSFSDDGFIDLPGFVEIYAFEQIGEDFYAVGGVANYYPALYKFSADGVLDAEFGEEGVASLGIEGFTEDAFITDDGKVYLTMLEGGSSHIYRATLEGNLDTSFFTGNSASFSSSENFVTLYATELMPDGSIITGGHAIDLFDSGSGQDFVAYRLTEEEMSVDENSSDVLIAYPNPTYGLIRIRGLSADSQVSLSSLDGKQLPITPEAREIDLSGFESGIYLLHIQDGAQVRTIRVVKK